MELLVVVGIVAVLVGLLAPALAAVRNQAKQTKCASQLHQLGTALVMYANHYRGALPAWSGWHAYPPGSPGDEPGEAWTEQLSPFYVPPDSPAYTCPSFDAGLITYFISGRWSASQGRHSTKPSELRLAPQFVLSGETTNRALYPPPYGTASSRRTTDCDPDDANAPCAVFPEEPGGFLAHPGGNNLLFGDLHVQAFRAPDPGAMTYDARAMRAWADVLPVDAAR